MHQAYLGALTIRISVWMTLFHGQYSTTKQ
jgi:hypothetical protein